MKLKKGRQQTLIQKLRHLLIWMIPIMIVFVVFCVSIYRNVRSQTLNEINSISGLYVDELDDRLFRISRRLLTDVMENGSEETLRSHLAAMEDPKNPVPANYYLNQLKDRAVSFTWEYGSEYHFFIYVEDTNQFIALDKISPQTAVDKNVELELLKLISAKEPTTYSTKQKWKALEVSEDNFLYKIASKNNVYFGCYVAAADLLKPLRNIDFGESGYAQLVNQKKDIISRVTTVGENNLVEERKELNNRPMPKEMIVNELKRAPFMIELYLSRDAENKVLTGVLTALIGLSLVIFIMSMLLLIFMRKNILGPIERFAATLNQVEDNQYPTEQKEFSELENINSHFNKMGYQIRNLKIDLYEQELQKKELEMDMLKKQMHPHFYLNGLNFIHNMLENNQPESAKKMLNATSDYLRFLFSNSDDKVAIKKELTHCKNYLTILKLRYGDHLDFYIELSSELEDDYIYPYIIQNFVENAAKHAVSLDQKVLVSVTVLPEEIDGTEFINVYISDTGRGFPIETVELLKNHQKIELSEGRGIGINNSVERLKHYYGKEMVINFDNSPLGGAIVDIHIPREYTKVDKQSEV